MPDFGDQAVRLRLGPSALRMFLRIAEPWQLSGEETRQLLCLTCAASLDKGDPNRLSKDQLRCISCLISIYEALHRVHGDPLADEWVQLPNSNAIFGEETPLTYVIKGGTEALQKLRKYVEGRAQGR